MPTRLAAVIMAGGLGTRMKSSLVKHLHPILGRRMVDWVVEAARPLGADPLVVVASPATADAFTGLEVAVQEEPLGTGDAVRSAREAVGDADEVLVLSGDTPLLTTELLGGLLDAHRAAGARRHGALVRPRRHPALRTRAPERRRRPRRDRGGGRRDARAAPGARGELVHLRVPGGRPLAGARAPDAGQCTGRALPHRCRQRARRRRRARRRARRARRGRDGGGQHAGRARALRRAPARPHQPDAHARRCDDRRPALDLDRADRDARAGHRRAPVHRPPRLDHGRHGRSRSARTPS